MVIWTAALTGLQTCWLDICWESAMQWLALVSSEICVTKIVSRVQGRGTLIGIMGAVTRGDGREQE